MSVKVYVSPEKPDAFFRLDQEDNVIVLRLVSSLGNPVIQGNLLKIREVDGKIVFERLRSVTPILNTLLDSLGQITVK